MNPILRKELRLIGPAWMIAMAAPVANFFMPGGSEVVFPIAALAALPLAVGAFGQEISLGTFGLLLAQPDRRARIWSIKTALAFIAMFAVVFVFIEGSRLHLLERLLHTNTRSLWASSSLMSELNLRPWFFYGAFGLALLSSGQWTALLFRHVVAACSLTLLIPLGIVIYITGAFDDQSPFWQLNYAEYALVVYAIAGFFLARWQFLRAQDTQWFGTTISSSAGTRGSFSSILRFSFRSRGPFLATLQKEVQLQQSAIIVAIGVALIHVASIVLLRTVPDLVTKYPALGSVWVLWLFVPLVSGTISVAEERRLNTLEASLSLPMRPWTRFLIKLAVVLVMGGVIGAGGLLLGVSYGGGMGAVLFSFLRERHDVVVAVVITAGGSFYVSTLCRNSLQALGAALLFFFASFFTTAVYWGIFISVLPMGPMKSNLAYWVTPRGPFLAVTFLVLAYRNFRLLQPNARNWMKDIFILFGVSALPLLLGLMIFNLSRGMR